MDCDKNILFDKEMILSDTFTNKIVCSHVFHLDDLAPDIDFCLKNTPSKIDCAGNVIIEKLGKNDVILHKSKNNCDSNK